MYQENVWQSIIITNLSKLYCLLLHQNSVYFKLNEKISLKQHNILILTKTVNILFSSLGFYLVSVVSLHEYTGLLKKQ